MAEIASYLFWCYFHMLKHMLTLLSTFAYRVRINYCCFFGVRRVRPTGAIETTAPLCRVGQVALVLKPLRGSCLSTRSRCGAARICKCSMNPLRGSRGSRFSRFGAERICKKLFCSPGSKSQLCQLRKSQLLKTKVVCEVDSRSSGSKTVPFSMKVPCRVHISSCSLQRATLCESCKRSTLFQLQFANRNFQARFFSCRGSNVATLSTSAVSEATFSGFALNIETLLKYEGGL